MGKDRVKKSMNLVTWGESTFLLYLWISSKEINHVMTMLYRISCMIYYLSDNRQTINIHGIWTVISGINNRKICRRLNSPIWVPWLSCRTSLSNLLTEYITSFFGSWTYCYCHSYHIVFHGCVSLSVYPTGLLLIEG